MSSISNQFHALPEELFYLVTTWVKEFDFRIVEMQLFPEFRVAELHSIANLEGSVIKQEETYSICLGLLPPDLSIDSRLGFFEKNPDYLVLNIGRLTKEGLRESFLSGMTNDQNLIKIWRKLVRHLRKETFTGLWATTPDASAKGFYKNARFTKGARELANNGTKLLSSGLWVYYVIDEPNLT